MPTCWDGVNPKNKTGSNHKSHMRYTLDGTVARECPSAFNHRVPQVQLFVRINNYKGGKYQLSDNSNVFHIDFFNGWQEGKLQEIIDFCPFDPDQGIGEYNPPYDCTPGEESNASFLTVNENIPAPMCNIDVRRLIIDEATDIATSLPRGTCQGPDLIPKWDTFNADLFACDEGNGPSTTTTTTTATTSATATTTTTMTASTTTTTTTTQPEEEEESDKRWVVCGRGVGDDLTVFGEGEENWCLLIPSMECVAARMENQSVVED